MKGGTRPTSPWVIAPDRQRQGLATEAAHAMVEWLAEGAVTDLPAIIDTVATYRAAGMDSLGAVTDVRRP